MPLIDLIKQQEPGDGADGGLDAELQRLGRGRIVVAVISDKYLKSPYCMYELLEVWRSGGFQERLFPVMLPDARIHRLTDQLDYVAFWQREIEGPLHSVRVASSALVRPAELRYANGQFTLH